MRKKITELKQGQKGLIVAIEPSEMSEKIMEMGCLPGEEITVEHLAPISGPIAVSLKGYKFFLRKKDASCILVEIN